MIHKVGYNAEAIFLVTFFSNFYSIQDCYLLNRLRVMERKMIHAAKQASVG